MANPTPQQQQLEQQIRDINDQLRGFGAGLNAAQLQTAISNASQSTADLVDLLSTLQDQLDKITNNADYLYKSFRDSVNELQKQNINLKEGKKIFSDLTNIARDLNYQYQGMSNLSLKDLRKKEEKIKLDKAELDIIVEQLSQSKANRDNQITFLQTQGTLNKQQKQHLDDLLAENKLLEESEEALRTRIPLLENEAKISQHIVKSRESILGLTGAIGQVLSKNLGPISQYLQIDDAIASSREFSTNLIQMSKRDKDIQSELSRINKELDQTNEELNNASTTDSRRKELLKEQNKLLKEREETVKKAAQSVNNILSKTVSLGIMLAKSLGSLKEALSDPVVLFGALASQAGKIDKELVQFQKSLSLTRTEAIGVRKEMALAAIASESNLINTHDLVKAQGNFNSLLGLQGEINEKNLTTQAELTKLLGVSAEAAAKLQFFSEATGQDFEQQKLAAYEATSAISAQYGVQVDQRQVMEEVGKQGAFALVQFKGSTAALAEAVAKAKALGISLEDVRQVAQGLLDFESSISAELEAELLTGKQINLERARLLALTNDQSGLMDELANQQITLNEFQNMNLIQQQSLAKSLGMSADKLSDMLLMEEYRNMNYKDIAALAGEDVAKRVEALTAQEKFNEAMIKLQSIIGDLVAGPLGQFLGVIGNILSNTYALAGILGFIAGSQLPAMLTGLRGIGRTFKYISVMAKRAGFWTAITKAIANPAGLLTGLIGAGTAIAAVTALANRADSTQQVQDGIAPASKGPFTITDKFGATAITTAGDSIAVSPNIITTAGNSITQSPNINRTSGGDNFEMISLMKKLAASPNIEIINPQPPKETKTINTINTQIPTNNKISENQNNSEMISLMKELVASNKNIEKKDSNLYMDSKAFGSNNVLGKATALGPSPSVFA